MQTHKVAIHTYGFRKFIHGKWFIFECYDANNNNNKNQLKLINQLKIYLFSFGYHTETGNKFYFSKN